MRAAKLSSTAKFETLSKETALLSNNIILVVMTSAVLLGTLFPLISDALAIGKISVGPPYFNMIMVPLAVVLVIVMGFGFVLRWKSDRWSRLQGKLWLPLIFALVTATILPLIYAPSFNGLSFMGLLMAGWVAFTALMWVLRLKRSPFKMSGTTWGAMLAHIGLAITFTGITLVSIYNVEEDIRVEKGTSYKVNEYLFTFEGVTEVEGPNYTAYQGKVKITKDGELLTVLQPEKRIYRVQTMPMTEAGIDAGIFRDLFVALGEPLGDKGAWSLRIQYKPFIRWIWLGAIFMGIGGLFAAFDRRYRRLNRRKRKSTVATTKGV
jgi:cytochrome c-type biogenesis protein CcmF